MAPYAATCLLVLHFDANHVETVTAPTGHQWSGIASFQVGSAALRHWIACGHGVGLARWRARAAAARELARLRRHHLYISARRGWACWVAAAAARRAFRDRAVDARWQLRSKREEGA